jgi:DNA modification methylase
MKERILCQVKLEELTEFEGNPRRMKTDWFAKLRTSINEHGFIGVIVIDENNRIIAGHQRVRALRQMGHTAPIDAIRLVGYTETELKAVNLALNQINGDWNTEKLTTWLSELKDADYNIYLAGFDDSDLEELDIELTDEEIEEDLAELESVSEEAGECYMPFIITGDLIELGEHRLLCGDSTDPAQVKRLMDGELAHLVFTDPPYNVNYGEFNKTRRRGKDWTDTYCPDNEDNMTREGYAEFLKSIVRNAKENTIEYAHYYVWFAMQYLPELTGTFIANDIDYDKVPIIWKKQTLPVSWANYKRNYEPCLFGGKGATTANKNSRWFGPNNERAVWEIDADSNNKYIHPTQKPTALAEKAIGNSSLLGELVLDLFGGSGSTLIACEKTDRKCRMMEKSEFYCFGIVDRWWKLTGIDEIRINGEVIDWSVFREQKAEETEVVE